jgi:hypothetical protein
MFSGANYLATRRRSPLDRVFLQQADLDLISPQPGLLEKNRRLYMQ